MTPTFTQIKNAVAEHFNIQADDLNVKDSSQSMGQARLMAVFIAANASYSNAEIAEAFNYKSASHVSSLFTKAHNRYVRATDKFYSDSRKIAKTIGLRLP